MLARINPSILAADFANLQNELDSISSADYVHVDVMDNHFVPNLTFGQQMVKRLHEISKTPIDLHLMISDVDKWALDFAKFGIFSITYHQEASQQPVQLARNLRDVGVRAGIALKPGTLPDFVIENLAEFDQVLVMTVEPGFGGQSFMPEMMSKVRAVYQAREQSKSNAWIQVDGGINENTIVEAANAGADTFVAGNAIFRTQNREMEIRKLREIATNALHSSG